MKNGRKANSRILAALIFCWLLSVPLAAFAGHGIEDTVENLTPERVKQLMDAGEKITFIDARPAKEFEQKHLPGARSIPIPEIASRFSEIPKSGRVVLYCDCKPYDVADRAVFLEYRGFRNVFIMPEGYQGWVKRGYPLETPKR